MKISGEKGQANACGDRIRQIEKNADIPKMD